MTVLTSTWRTVRGNFAPLQYPNFRLYLGGQAISLIGTWLQVTAQSWVVWQLTHSETAFGIVGMLNGLPILFLSAYAGVWIDRLDRRKLLIGTQIVSMLLAFILALLAQTNIVQIWHVYVLSLLLGVANALDLPAQQAFLGDLAGKVDIKNALNLNIMIMQAGRILGPAIAGLIVAHVGIASAFWLNGFSFLAVIASLVLVRANQVIVSHSGQVSPLHQMAEGLTYVRTNPRLQDLFIFAVLMMFFFFAIPYNILPAVADKMLSGDAAILGALLTAVSAGALLSLLFVVPIVQSFTRSGLVMFVTLFWIAFWVMVFAHSYSLPLSMLALGMANVGGPIVMNTAWGLVHLMSPTAMRGRVIALYTAVSYGIQPLAALWIGWAAQDSALGVSSAIQFNALLLIAGAIGLFIFRRIVLQHEYPSTAEREEVSGIAAAHR
jgi:MFS family permease